MNFLRSPRNKVLAACAALLALLLMASANGLSATVVARGVLALAALLGLGWWYLKARRSVPAARFQLAPRMTVVSRQGLSQRAGMALVEVDGRSFLVVHGEGYAEICATLDKPAKPRAPRATDSHPGYQPRRPIRRPTRRIGSRK